VNTKPTIINKSTNILFSRRVRWYEVVLVAVALLGFYLYHIQTALFHPDEANRIATSDAFEEFFNGRFDSRVWKKTYWTLTQPPITRFWTGLGRRLGGYIPTDFQSLWVDGREYTRINSETAANVTPRLLWWSRLPMAVLAAVSVLFLFFLCFKVSGRLAGYLALLLFVGSDYFTQLWPRAMGEAPLLAAILGAWYAGYRAVQNWEGAAWQPGAIRRHYALHSLLWFCLMGFLCGIAGASKMNGASITLGAGLLAVLTPLVRRGNLPKAYRLRFLFAASGLVAVLAAFGFIGPNPFLYSDVALRTTQMLDNRFVEMRHQLSENPDDAITTPKERVSAISFCIFQDCTPLRFPTGRFINLTLFLVGTGSLLTAAWRWLKGGSMPEAETEAASASVMTLAIAVTASAPVLMTPINWNRYFMLPTVFTLVCVAVGATWLLRKITFRG
jgi:hypothetical protein